MSTKEIIVKGSGSNLYSIDDSSDTIYVYKGKGYGKTQLAKVKCLEDALAIIKNHSGRDIESIE